MIRKEIQEKGWARFQGVEGSKSLLELANIFGQPLNSPKGNLVQEVRITSSERALPHTLSAQFGEGEFPLHTDTAFWPTPARFLVMKVLGDMRRRTTVCAVRDLLTLHGSGLAIAIKQSIWTLRALQGSTYCSMEFDIPGDAAGMRYDRQCMFPANSAARRIDSILRSRQTETAVAEIEWTENSAIVIDNWRSLHGRGPEPPDEQERILQRIYVR